jgi:large subunit ribosomal protein L23
MNVRGKLRRRGKEFGYTADWKKAVVTLALGDQIELFEGV